MRTILGWVKCDGLAMDKTADNLLFQVIGYTFGGSGNSFNLPNPAGRVMGTVGTVTDDNYCGVPMRGEFPFKTGLTPVLI